MRLWSHPQPSGNSIQLKIPYWHQEQPPLHLDSCFTLPLKQKLNHQPRELRLQWLQLWRLRHCLAPEVRMKQVLWLKVVYVHLCQGTWTLILLFCRLKSPFVLLNFWYFHLETKKTLQSDLHVLGFLALENSSAGDAAKKKHPTGPSKAIYNFSNYAHVDKYRQFSKFSSFSKSSI